MNQILLITDGCSNAGGSPAAAAAVAKAEGITVNVIGLLGGDEFDERGAEEVSAIAGAGGGIARLVQPKLLSRTVQMMTRRTAVQTVQHAVERELRQILGQDKPLEALPPEQRGQVVQLIDDRSETLSLRVALVIDTSASMKPKLGAVREAIQDLMLSLRAREGSSEICVFHFPGRSGEADLSLPWTSELANVERMFYNLDMRGTTPTGPALLRATDYLSARIEGGKTAETADRSEVAAKDGMLGDYVV
ncbi:VWA domain-containing protein [Paenibacillus thermoaerophilus]|uniref:VWA domain-containing protein n=1 Tax=Paenibacillus thermoaerophilus TaxID=1215385 RepID=A0ABW2UYK7_9BACL|nr:vWA domain-containing protein [Paenibacillus thermoaerophilus]TMV09488.1 VWA domain-containing protein [Paenibacillus thermoaerophilus]